MPDDFLPHSHKLAVLSWQKVSFLLFSESPVQFTKEKTNFCTVNRIYLYFIHYRFQKKSLQQFVIKTQNKNQIVNKGKILAYTHY